MQDLALLDWGFRVLIALVCLVVQESFWLVCWALVFLWFFLRHRRGERTAVPLAWSGSEPLALLQLQTGQRELY